MNLLEIRQEEIKEITEEEIKIVCKQLKKILSDASNFEITFNKEHVAPTTDNSYIGDFTEVNKFNEEIKGRALFFPNTQFICKNSNDPKIDVVSFYLVNTCYGFKMIIKTETTYKTFKSDLLKYKLDCERLSDELYYSYEENQIRHYYASRLASVADDRRKLNNITFCYKKSGEPFKDLNKCIKYKSLFGYYYPLEMHLSGNVYVNRDYLTNYTLNAAILNENEPDEPSTEEEFNRTVIDGLKKNIEQIKITIEEDIKHYQFILDNVRELVNDYLKKEKRIQAIKETLNCDISRILGD